MASRSIISIFPDVFKNGLISGTILFWWHKILSRIFAFLVPHRWYGLVFFTFDLCFFILRLYKEEQYLIESLYYFCLRTLREQSQFIFYLLSINLRPCAIYDVNGLWIISPMNFYSNHNINQKFYPKHSKSQSNPKHSNKSN